jgi:hypothetical protein
MQPVVETAVTFIKSAYINLIIKNIHAKEEL